MVDQSYELLACTYIRTQLEQLQAQIEGAKQAEDIEFIHQARVATRRLRAGFNLFAQCFPAKRLKTWQQKIRRITKRLGSARDKDVQIEFMQKTIAGLTFEQKAFKPGIKRLMLRLQQSRDEIQPAVVKQLIKFESSRLLADIYGEIEKTMFYLKHRNVTLQSKYVFTQARKNIAQRISDLHSYESSLNNPNDKKSHHAMRIAAKKLRYTLEICDIAFDKQLKESVKTIKKTQTYLGDIHDCDIWDDFIKDFIEEEHQRTLEYFGHERTFKRLQKGLEFLRDDRRRCRQETFIQFRDYWHDLEDNGFWQGLLAQLDDRLKAYTDNARLA